jgi:Protein of unknown function (DUF1566)
MRNNNATSALIALGLLGACMTGNAEAGPAAENKTEVGVGAVSTVPTDSVAAGGVMPDIGTKMGDGTVYAGLSMETGKPSFIAAAGGKMADGTVYAGLSPDTGKPLYTTVADAPGVYTWSRAVKYCKGLSSAGHRDWRMPSLGELAVQFSNRADIGGFNETGKLKNASGYYWSSLQVGDDQAWGQVFSDGFHEDFSKDLVSSLRCVR